MSEKLIETRNFSTASEACDWAHAEMVRQALFGGDTVERKSRTTLNRGLLVQGWMKNKKIFFVEFITTYVGDDPTYHLTKFSYRGKSLMAKIEEGKPEVKTDEFTRPTFVSTTQAVEWATEQIEHIHRKFGVKPDGPSHWSIYPDNRVYVETTVNGQIAVEVSFRPVGPGGVAVASWVCCGLTVHL